jgi:ATP-dependent DNA helicase RecQ
MAIKRLTGMHPTRLTVIIAELVEQQFLRKISQNGLQVYQIISNNNALDLTRYINQLTVKKSELTAIQHYAEQSNQCLMVILRNALGDSSANPCGHCSVCAGPIFKSAEDGQQISAVAKWLSHRTVSIILDRRVNKQNIPGIAILDGKLHAPAFVHFMRHRSVSDRIEVSLHQELLQLIKDRLADLANQHTLGCIVPVPSRTWLARDAMLKYLSDYLGIPALPDLLRWRQLPAARQGELLNNDQRRENVAKRMYFVRQTLPAGTILLLDDYLGSGATLNEAARALSVGVSNKVLPFTIAAVKWHLGKRGMV